MEVNRILITPEIAEAFLKHNNRNRAISNATVQSYATAMKNGLWEDSPEPISFYEDGTLRDGQHRLKAILASGVSIFMYVATGVPNSSVICDVQRVRQTRDILKMSDYEPILYSSTVTTAVRFLTTPSHNKGSSAITKAFIDENSELIKHAYSLVSGRSSAKSRLGAVFAAILCADFDGVDECTLVRFCNVLDTGFYNNESETSAIVLRNMLSANLTRSGMRAVFNATTRAISDFERGISRRKSYNTQMPPRYYDEFKKALLSKWI